LIRESVTDEETNLGANGFTVQERCGSAKDIIQTARRDGLVLIGAKKQAPMRSNKEKRELAGGGRRPTY